MALSGANKFGAIAVAVAAIGQPVAGYPYTFSKTGVAQSSSMRIGFSAGDDPVAQGFAFTRSSTGTFVGSNGLLQTAAANVLRYTYDPVTLQPLGALIEQQATNIVPSTTTESAATGGVTATTGQTDPTGATGATLITCTAGVATHTAAAGNVSYTAGTTYTLSRWIKVGTATRVQLYGTGTVFTTLDEYANFDLSSRTVTAQGAGCLAAGVDLPASGFQRVWFTAVADATASFVSGPVTALLVTGSEGRAPSVEGGGLTFTVYGSQVEAGPLTSYIIPAGATTTRAADSLTLTGSAGRTNWIKNSTGVGGTASVVPTGWTSPLTQAGVTASVVGKGTSAEFGDYWDVRFQGTATASGDLRVYFGGPTDIPSANGVQWTLSAALARVAGTVPAGRTFNLVIAQRDSGTAFLTATSADISATAGASLARLSHTTTTSHASVAYLWTYFNCAIQIGDVVDFTLRVAAPQAEKAAGFTGYIPTSGYARTVENIASWWNNDEGTFIWRGRVGPAFSLTAVMMAAAGDATMANAQWLYLSATARRVTGEGRSGGAATLYGMVMGSTIAAGQDVVASWAYGADYGLAVASGVAATADTSGALPVGMSRFSIGSGAASGLLTVASQLIASIEYYPRKLTPAEQLALTY